MARTRYKHFKSVVICQCELKVVFLSLDLFTMSHCSMILPQLTLVSFMRAALLLYYIWYYENLMIHWARQWASERARLKSYPTIPPSFIWKKKIKIVYEKLPMIKFNTFTKAELDQWERGKQWSVMCGQKLQPISLENVWKEILNYT
jgi:hypothetical protein